MLSFELWVVAIALVGNIFLALFTLLKNPKSSTNKLFFLFTIIIAAYNVFNYMITHSASDTTFFWVKLVMSIAVVINILFYLLAVAFPKTKMQLSRTMIIASIAYSLLMILASQNNLIYSGIVMEGKNVGNLPGPAMPLFLLHTVLYLGGGFFILIKKFRKATGLEKAQLRLFISGAVFLFLCILVTNLLFVLVFKFSGLIGLLPIYTLVFIGFVSYAIVRHRLLDIHLILARSIAYILLLVLLASFYTADVFLISNYFFNANIDKVEALIYALITLFIAFTFPPLKNMMEEATDFVFFKNKYNSNELILNLTKIMASSLHLEELGEKSLHQLLETMHVTKGSFIIFKYVVLRDQGEYQKFSEGYDKEPHFESSILNKLFYEKRMIIYDEEQNDEVRKMMRALDISILLPLYDDNHDEGVLVLGEKKAGDLYSQQDIEVLKIFAPGVSVAIQNAKSYDEISRFNATLRNEVEKATKDLKIANQRLKDLDVLKDEFVSVASHELRTPMTAIKSYLWMAIEGRGGPLNEKQSYYIQRAYGSVDRLINLVNDMLNSSRIESGRLKLEMQAVNLDKLSRDVVEEITPRAKELGINVNVDCKDGLSPVIADPDKIKEVLINLLGNSMKFTPEGGNINISLSPKDKMMEVRVIDNGAGVAASDMPKLFQKFGLLPGSYAANRQVTGTGLGLYICKSIIDLHEGAIWAHSEGEGKGAEFGFSLKVFNEADLREIVVKNNNKMKEDLMGVMSSA